MQAIYPGGIIDNSPTFQRWVADEQYTLVPKGRLNRGETLSRPFGTNVSPRRLPNVETLGYYRLSLWDINFATP
jgi:hypothetical protein